MTPPLKELVSPDKAALIVVDVQNTFVHPQGRSARVGNDLTQRQVMVEKKLVPLIEEARRAKVPVIFIHSTAGLPAPWTDNPPDIGPGGLGNAKGLVPFGEENRALQTQAEVDVGDLEWERDFYLVHPTEDEYVVYKYRNSAFIGTDFDLVLRSQGIKNLILSGVAGNVCVEATSRDGFMMGYRILFVEDCTHSRSEEQQRGTLVNVDKFFGMVTTSEAIISEWRRMTELVPSTATQGG